MTRFDHPLMTTPDDLLLRPGPTPVSSKAISDGDIRRTYRIASLGRALDMIEAMARIGPASLSDLATEAHCSRTAGFRLLRTLQERGFAIQDQARGSWRLGARWDSVGRAATAQGALAAAAQPHLQMLGRTTGEVAYLVTRAGMESETIAAFRPDDMLPHFARIGERGPLHAGPARFLLAHAPEVVQAHVLAQRLPRFTQGTPTDPKWIAGDLRRLRVRPWSVFTAELRPGTVAVAAPVRDSGGTVVGVIEIVAASHRMRAQRVRAISEPVFRTALALSAALGFKAPSEESA